MEAVKQEFETKVIAVDRIRPNGWNKGREPSPEFVESIRKNGVLQSILVRPGAGAISEYEIIAGERRWKGAQEAGLVEIECRVVQADDAQAQELTLIENFDRDDLTPLEVAQRIAELLAIHHGDVREVAARVGRSRAFVASRRALAGLDMSLFGKDAAEMPISCLELIAKLPPNVQQDLAKENHWVLQDYSRLHRMIVGMSKGIAGAPWDSDDETLLPVAGACANCPKRSGADPDLFGDLKGMSKADKCLDADCYKSKQAAFTLRQETELRAKHPDLLRVAERIPYDLEEDAKDNNVFSYGDYDSKYEKCKKGDKGAVPAVEFYGPKAGALVYVKPTKRASSQPSKKPASEKTLKEKRAELRIRRLAHVVDAVRGLIDGAPLHKSLQTWEELAKIAAVWHCDHHNCDLGDYSIDRICNAIRVGSISSRIYSLIHNGKPSEAAIMAQLAMIYGPQASEQFDLLMESAAEKIPEPKCWTKDAPPPEPSAPEKKPKKPAKTAAKKSPKKAKSAGK